METESSREQKGEKFADFVIKKLQDDNAFGAALRRADNLATEYQSWEYLVRWCDLDKPWERLPFIVIAAALARAKPNKDGSLNLGKCIALCYEDGNQSDAAKTRLRRILACDNIEEICRVLRTTLRLIQSRGVSINYGGLLNELLWFNERHKIRWATDFYGRRDDHDRHNA